jgi:xylulokinase
MKNYILGIDIGTSSCKTIVIDTDGNVVDSARYEYGISCPQYGWAEQNPEDWYQAFRWGLQEIFSKHPNIAKKISAIGVTGQMIGLTLLDKEGSVIRPAIIWMDQRCLPQVDYLKEHFEETIWSIALNPINITYTLPKMLWVKENEPEVWERVYKVQLPKDYVRLRLTDRWAVDYHDVSGTLLFDVTNLCWADEIIDLVGFERDKLPDLLPSWEIAGYVSKTAASELGIQEGIPVVAGAGDLATENLSAGIISSDQLLTRLGTAGSTSTSTESPLPDPKKIAPCYVHCIEGRWLAEIADHTFGLCENWFRDTFFSAEKKEAQEKNIDFYHKMDNMAEETPIGAEGLIFHPFNHGGPYWNPQLRGSFYGINFRHTKGHFFRAMLEGSVFCLKDSILLLEERIGKSVPDYSLVGGGSKSTLWTQMICDIVQKDAHILKTADASLGAAMLGGLGTQIFSSPEDAIKHCVEREKEVHCNRENSKKYEILYEVYQKVHENLMEDSRLIQATVDKIQT